MADVCLDIMWQECIVYKTILHTAQLIKKNIISWLHFSKYLTFWNTIEVALYLHANILYKSYLEVNDKNVNWM